MGLKSFTFVGILLAASLIPAQDQLKIACVGNSITEGYGLNWNEKKYPDNLQTFLDQSAFFEGQFQVSNFGHSGRMFHKASGESYWNSEKFTAAYSYGADIVVIELGTNDSKYFYDGKGNSSGFNYMYKPEYKADLIKDYESLIDTFAHQPQSPTIFATLQPYAQNEEWGIIDTAIVNVINPIIKNAAIKKGVNLIDLHALFNKPEWLLDDVVHPNALGAQELASIIAKFVHPGNRGSILQKKNVLKTSSNTDECFWYKDDVLLEGETSCTLTITETGKYKVSNKYSKDQETRIVSEIEVTDLEAGVSDGNSYSSSSNSLPGSNSSTILPGIPEEDDAEPSSSSSTENPPTKISSNGPSSQKSTRIFANGRTISIENYEGAVSLVDLNGNLITNLTTSGFITIPIEKPGTYVVKAGSCHQMILLK